jgi:hypothetical protein
MAKDVPLSKQGMGFGVVPLTCINALPWAYEHGTITIKERPAAVKALRDYAECSGHVAYRAFRRFKLPVPAFTAVFSLAIGFCAAAPRTTTPPRKAVLWGTSAPPACITVCRKRHARELLRRARRRYSLAPGAITPASGGDVIAYRAPYDSGRLSAACGTEGELRAGPSHAPATTRKRLSGCPHNSFRVNPALRCHPDAPAESGRRRGSQHR